MTVPADYGLARSTAHRAVLVTESDRAAGIAGETVEDGSHHLPCICHGDARKETR